MSLSISYVLDETDVAEAVKRGDLSLAMIAFKSLETPQSSKEIADREAEHVFATLASKGIPDSLRTFANLLEEARP